MLKKNIILQPFLVNKKHKFSNFKTKKFYEKFIVVFIGYHYFSKL